MKIKILRKILFTILTLSILSINSSAQVSVDKLQNEEFKSPLLKSDVSASDNLYQTKTKKQRDFTFSTNLYLWAISLNGMAALPVNKPSIPITQTPELDVSLKFSDAIKNLKFAAMLAGNLMYKNFGLLYDFSYVKLGYDGSVPVASNYFSGTITAKQFNGDFALLYKFPAKNKKLQVSGYAGVRIFAMDNTIDLVYIDNTILSVNKAKTWVDPIIGVSSRIDISKHWLTYFKGDVGGFGLSSKFTGSILWTIGYKFTDQWNTNLGFKYLYTDYDKDSFLWKVSQYGALLSFGYMFK